MHRQTVSVPRMAFLGWLIGSFVLITVGMGCRPAALPEPPRIVRPSDQVAPQLIALHLSHTIGQAGSGPGQLQDPHGLALDAQDRLYVADTGNHRVQLLASDGTFLAEYGQRGWRPGEFESPMDVAVRDVWLYIADTGNSRIQAGLAQEARFQVLMVPDLPLPLDVPQAVATDGVGGVYTVDAWQHNWVRIGATGKLTHRVGEFGALPQQFREPTDLALDSARNLYVADSQNHRIQVFDFGGSFVRDWSVQTGDGEHGTPVAIAVDRWQRIYVGELAQPSVHAYERDGTLMIRVDHPDLTSVGGLAVDRRGRVYVSDPQAGDIKVFRSVFRPLGAVAATSGDAP